MMLGNQPIIILKEGTTREKGKDALSNNIMAALAISDAVKSTLGPKGMDKMLVDNIGDVIITNDGATILKEIDVEHPAAKMIVEVAKSQDEECGDGTTTAVILTGELLKYASQLIDQNVHPSVITRGFKIASDKSIEILNEISISLKNDDREILRKIAITSMSSKGGAGSAKGILSNVIVNAVTSVLVNDFGKNSVDLDNIKIQKQKGGAIENTETIKGIIIDKGRVHENMPKFVKNAKIAIVNAAFEVKKTEIDARIQIYDPSQLQAFLNEEEGMIRNMVEKVKKSGATVLICQKSIDDIAQYYLAKNNVYTISNVNDSDINKLSKATSAKIVVNIDDLNNRDLGFAGLVEERKFGEDKLTFVMDCKNPKAVSILLRGGTEHVVNELERGLHDALFVVKVALEDGKITVGGGASAIEISMALRDFAPSIGGREQMAIEGFANSLEIIPKTLSENAGLDPINIILEMRRLHKKGNKYAGVNVLNGKVEDMFKNDVLEPLRLGTHEIQTASEAATMILRIDDVISSKSSKKISSNPGNLSGDYDDY